MTRNKLSLWLLAAAALIVVGQYAIASCAASRAVDTALAEPAPAPTPSRSPEALVGVSAGRFGCDSTGLRSAGCEFQWDPVKVDAGTTSAVWQMPVSLVDGMQIQIFVTTNDHATSGCDAAFGGCDGFSKKQLVCTYNASTGKCYFDGAVATPDDFGTREPVALLDAGGTIVVDGGVSFVWMCPSGPSCSVGGSASVNPIRAGDAGSPTDSGAIDSGSDSGAPPPAIASITPNYCVGGKSKVAVAWTGGQTGTTTIQAVGESAPGTCTGTSSPVTCTCPAFPANGTGGTAVNATITVGGNTSGAATSALLFHDTNIPPAALWSDFSTTGAQAVWLDVSGENACDGGACNAPSANSPTTAVINGLNAASLTAASSQSFTFAGAICGNGRWSAAAVAKPNLQGAFIVLAGPGVTGGVVGDYGFGSTSDQNLQGTDFSTGGPATTTGTVTTGSLHFAGLIDNFLDTDGGAATTYVQLDSTLSAPVGMAATTLVTNFTIGAGYSAGFALYYDGLIGDQIIYCGGISLAALEREHQLFKTRWGTP